MSPLQPSYRSLVARVPKRISALCLRVKFVLGHNVAIRFDIGCPSRSTVALSRYFELLFRVLVNPFLIEPLPGIGIVWRYKVKFLGIDTVSPENSVQPMAEVIPSK